MEMFGVGSEGVCSKLLDDLAVNPSGERWVSWDIGIRTAIDSLNELKRREVGEKRKEKRKKKGKG